MTNRKTKQERKAVMKLIRAEERAKARNAFPLPPRVLKALFNHLDVALPKEGCDHSRRITQSWLQDLGHPVEPVFKWLDDNGGFCDCEVLANVEETFDDAMRDA